MMFENCLTERVNLNKSGMGEPGALKAEGHAAYASKKL